MKSIKNASGTLLSLLFLGGLLFTFYTTEHYLDGNFAYSGESYMKGAGHLLREELGKGLFFLISRHFGTAFFFTAFVFSLISSRERGAYYLLFRWFALLVLLLVMVYFSFRVSDLFYDPYVNWQRVVEICLTWGMRVAGFFTGYMLLRGSRMEGKADSSLVAVGEAPPNP